MNFKLLLLDKTNNVIKLQGLTKICKEQVSKTYINRSVSLTLKVRKKLKINFCRTYNVLPAKLKGKALEIGLLKELKKPDFFLFFNINPLQ